ncbi:hypothetical protein BGZ98_009994 [Dissophora globulifera]|nr:hypothetical protein BGZ98_009994 [Dissophora globulifera]
MGRQRSLSTSSIGTLSKSPTSLSVSLSTSVALYDNQQPPKTLQDILLLAQSHYISHRYVPAMTLYKLAAEKHHSLPACNSLYALYTSTLNVPGLAKSDTKAVHILLHALRIWTARRWSSARPEESHSGGRAMRSRIRDEHDELEEYFVHARRQPSRIQRRTRSGGALPILTETRSRLTEVMVAQSAESEYRTPFHLAGQDEAEGSGDRDEKVDDDYDSEDYDDAEGSDTCTDCEECDSDSDSEDDDIDEEEEREEEARRIGLATSEIEDIVQKLCLMTQKGVLGLDEPILIEAVSVLRKIERGLTKETDAWRQEMARSKSLFTSTLSGASSDNNLGSSTSQSRLLLTQGIDLSFLNCGSDDDGDLPMAQARSVSRPVGLRPMAKIQDESIRSPVNSSIAGLSFEKREQDQSVCRAIRIRIMSTLGWVHEKKGEFHYAAQAYGVCSELAPTGKRPLAVLQHQALIQKDVCKELEQRQLELEKKSEMEKLEQERRKSTSIHTEPPSSSSSITQHTLTAESSCASSVYTPSESSARITHPDISSPSSLASSDSEGISVRGSSGPMSSLSAAVWNSGLFRSSSNTSVPTLKGTSIVLPSSRLQRSKSLLLEHKSKPVQTAEAKQAEDSHRHHHHHRHPQPQQNSSETTRQQQLRQQSAPVLTMSGHKKQAVKCAHCGQAKILMPLCVCKKVRYCNGECRIADLEAHQQTGCHAARIGIGAMGLSVNLSAKSYAEPVAL